MAYYNDNQTQTAKKFSNFWKYDRFLLFLQNKKSDWVIGTINC